MPRGPRLDAPGLLHHVRARGIERRKIYLDESYFLALIRYIHLNPVRARIVTNVRELKEFPWTGHAALMASAITKRAVRGENVMADLGLDLESIISELGDI